MKYTLIWYDMEKEVTRDTVNADSEEDAIKKGYEKYNGNPPAKLVNAVKEI